LRILIATDLWLPLRYGVEQMLHRLVVELRAQGDVIEVLGPDRFETAPSALTPDLRLASNAKATIAPMIHEFAPEAIHIATEGTLGLAARGWCLKTRQPFTSSYLTKLPEFAEMGSGQSPDLIYAKLRQFHLPATRLLVPTASVAEELRARGFTHLHVWTLGVDTDLFHPRQRAPLELPRPVHLYVGRISAEKNLTAFLDLALPGSKVVVGDGPLLGAFRQRYPGVAFHGRLEGKSLAQIYASADVFVFPGRADTFGLVMLEALASGLPVAAYPVPGPRDIIGDSGAGALDKDLARAVATALTIPRERARAHALTFSWARSAEQFRSLLVPRR
jgi:glycosyltransferase involved in cell wall biosynthesis